MKIEKIVFIILLHICLLPTVSIIINSFGLSRNVFEILVLTIAYSIIYIVCNLVFKINLLFNIEKFDIEPFVFGILIPMFLLKIALEYSYYYFFDSNYYIRSYDSCCSRCSEGHLERQIKRIFLILK